MTCQTFLLPYAAFLIVFSTSSRSFTLQSFGSPVAYEATHQLDLLKNETIESDVPSQLS